MNCAYRDESAKVGGLALGLADWLSIAGIREQSPGGGVRESQRPRTAGAVPHANSLHRFSPRTRSGVTNREKKR